MPKLTSSRLLQQVVPAEDIDSHAAETPDKRSSKRVTRPPFSLPVMTNNFRRFNARHVYGLGAAGLVN